MKHRIIAVLLALCLVAGLVPMAAAAESFEESVNVEQLIGHAIQMYLTLEGNYDHVTCLDSNATSIGFMQWHGNNAKELLQMICNDDPAFGQETLGATLYNEVMSTASWKNRALNSAEAAKVKALISSDLGIYWQNTFAASFIYDEAKTGFKRGIRTEPALLYYCSIENQFGIGGASNVLGYLRETMTQDMGIIDPSIIDSLQLFHNVWLRADASGRYPNSISRYKNARVKVYNFLVNTLGLDPTGDSNDTPFEDLPPSGHWARRAISWAYNHTPQITAGTSATTFSPDAAVTRGEAMTFLWAAAGKPEPTSAENPFKDVKKKDFYYKAVLWAVERGITAGTSATTFSPKASVTRAEMLTFLWASEGKPTLTDVNNPFTDVKAHDYYYQPVLWTLANQVLVGNEGEGNANLLKPKQPCSRAYVVTYLYNLFSFYG